MRYVNLGLAVIGMMLSTGAVARERKADANMGPNKIVCRSEQNTGSRLATTKRCMSAREWAEEKAVNKQDIERVQAMRWTNKGG